MKISNATNNQLNTIAKHDHGCPSSLLREVVREMLNRNLFDNTLFSLINSLVNLKQMEQVYKISEEDLLQIGRTAIYEALDKFTPGKGKAFSSYAYMVANSELIMFIRKLQRGKRDPRKVTSLNEKLDENGEYEMYFPSPVNIEKYVLNKIELEESLKQINDYQRKVILLRWQGYTYEEISGMTGKTINAVNKTYLKAIGKMRKGA